jgi:cell division protein FtsW (lipid II flippase)
MMALSSNSLENRWSPFLRSLLLCAPVPALLVGIRTMRQAGVPTAVCLINVAATFAGLLLFALIRYVPRSARQSTQFTFAAAAIAAILLPFASKGMLGVHRWVSLGGLRLHASAIVAPLIIASIAAIARQRLVVTIAIALLGTSILALQPDAAQAFSFAAACITILAFNVERQRSQAVGGMLLLIAAASLAFSQNDRLPPVPHVEGILTLVASTGFPWAVLGIAALLLLPIPFFAIFARNPDRVALALGVYLTMTILAPLWGTFPVPIMGYGASPILGYFIALALCDRTSAIDRASVAAHPRNRQT